MFRRNKAALFLSLHQFFCSIVYIQLILFLSNGIDIFVISGSFQSQSCLVKQDFLIPAILYVRLQDFGIDRIPPTVGTADNHIKIIWVIMHVVFCTVVPDHIADFFFYLGCDSVFTCIHVGNFGVSESLGKLSPCFVRHIVRLPNVQTPDLALR